MKKFKALVVLFCLVTFYGCTVVKTYNKVAINDADMQLQSYPCERFEIIFQIYREAAAGANGGKIGGGCGCN